jgi:hypothetical protein
MTQNKERLTYLHPLRAFQKHEVGAWIELYQQIDDFLGASVYQQLLGL